jgi:hypothetical protein
MESCGGQPGHILYLVNSTNIFVDVDLTLVDAEGRLLDGAREALQRLHDKGCHLFLWSSAGADYARKARSGREAFGVRELAPAFGRPGPSDSAGKPDALQTRRAVSSASILLAPSLPAPPPRR